MTATQCTICSTYPAIDTSARGGGGAHKVYASSATISRSDVVWIAPDCPPEVEAMIRRDAAAKGQQVMPARPFPWNRKAADEKTVAERKWRSGLKPKTAQRPCDAGLFGDSHQQKEMKL